MTNGHDQLSAPIRHKYAILHAPICGIPLGKKYIREKLLKWNQAEFCLVFRVLCVCESILEHKSCVQAHAEMYNRHKLRQMILFI